jgi:hypothetical protein
MEAKLKILQSEISSSYLRIYNAHASLSTSMSSILPPARLSVPLNPTIWNSRLPIYLGAIGPAPRKSGRVTGGVTAGAGE